MALMSNRLPTPNPVIEFLLVPPRKRACKNYQPGKSCTKPLKKEKSI